MSTIIPVEHRRLPTSVMKEALRLAPHPKFTLRANFDLSP
jgi:hypothetical protein